MTNPTFQELLTSQEARFTNEQLEAWAGLGPWGHRVDIVRAEEGETFPWGTIYKDLPDPITLVYMTLQPDSIKSNAALIAAAPALAAALLAERKAREVEVGELRAAVEKARLTFNRQPIHTNVDLATAWTEPPKSPAQP